MMINRKKSKVNMYCRAFSVYTNNYFKIDFFLRKISIKHVFFSLKSRIFFSFLKKLTEVNKGIFNVSFFNNNKKKPCSICWRCSSRPEYQYPPPPPAPYSSMALQLHAVLFVKRVLLFGGERKWLPSWGKTGFRVQMSWGQLESPY